MELRGIDVSSYQGMPDWQEVAKSGVEFAILRVVQLYGVDSSFLYNYRGCRDNNIPVGVYCYSYALTEAQADQEARQVIAALDGRAIQYPVFYDMEWQQQRDSLSRERLTSIINTFRRRIIQEGYIFGIYCNQDWYDNVLDVASMPYYYWIASYPEDDYGQIDWSLRPAEGIGWQYSSKGHVPGIDGDVDLDLFFKDFANDTSRQDKDATCCIHSERRIFVGEVTATALNVRTCYGKDLNGDYYPRLEEYPLLDRGNLVEVLRAYDAEGTTWYKIKIAGRYIGYVDGNYIARV